MGDLPQLPIFLLPTWALRYTNLSTDTSALLCEDFAWAFAIHASKDLAWALSLHEAKQAAGRLYTWEGTLAWDTTV